MCSGLGTNSDSSTSKKWRLRLRHECRLLPQGRVGWQHWCDEVPGGGDRSHTLSVSTTQPPSLVTAEMRTQSETCDIARSPYQDTIRTAVSNGTSSCVDHICNHKWHWNRNCDRNGCCDCNNLIMFIRAHSFASNMVEVMHECTTSPSFCVPAHLCTHTPTVHC